MKIVLGILILAVLFLPRLSSFLTHTRNYEAAKPVLRLEDFFNGAITSGGLIHDWKGTAGMPFQMHMQASWKDGVGTLHEEFHFSDGRTYARDWKLTKRDEHTYIGTAPDVVGEAKGEIYGNTLRWRYTMRLPVGGSHREVQLDDWLHLIDDTHLISLIEMSKWGIKVGSMTMFFEKKS